MEGHPISEDPANTLGSYLRSKCKQRRWAWSKNPPEGPPLDAADERLARHLLDRRPYHVDPLGHPGPPTAPGAHRAAAGRTPGRAAVFVHLPHLTTLETRFPLAAPPLRSPGGATTHPEKSTQVHTAKNPHQSHQSQPKTNTFTHKLTNEKVFGVKNSVVARPPSVLPCWFSNPETTGCRTSPCGVPSADERRLSLPHRAAGLSRSKAEPATSTGPERRPLAPTPRTPRAM